MLAAWFNIPLWARVMGGLVLGIAVGLAWGPGAEAVKPIGDIFMRAIRMLVVPLVFASIVAGVTQLGSPSQLGRVGGKMILIYVSSMVVAVGAGMLWAGLIQPGAGTQLAGLAQADVQHQDVSLIKVLVNMVPENIVKAMAEMQVLAMIVFAVLFGLGIVAAGEKAAPVKAFVDGVLEVMFKITGWVMELAPFGVFALIAVVVGNNGPEVLLPLGKLIGTLYIGGAVHFLLVMVLLVWLVGRLNILRFIRNGLDALVVAFSTSSSNATLPVAMRVTEQNMGVHKRVSGFVMPMGASLSMDGTVMHFGIVTVFAAQLFGVDLSLADYAVIMLVSVLAGMGASGIPSASLIMLPMVLGAVGLPIEVIALIAGVDRILDMMRTTLNVSIDLVVCTLVGKSENALDMAVFNGSAQRS
jgi:Na+/H+-dicarboxylate symporter